MNEKTKFDVELVQLTNIVVNNARISNDSSLSEIDFSKDILAYRFGYNLAVSEDFKSVKMLFSCEAKSVNKTTREDSKITGHFEIAYVFTVGNLKDLVDGFPPKTIDSDLVIALANIAYSTSRGILFTRCQGTVLKQLILPVMPTSKLIALFDKREKESKTNG